MSIVFENYPMHNGFGSRFSEVRDFLIRINEKEITTPNFLWARWEWMFSLPFMDQTALDRIGIWRDGRMIVALATYESSVGEVFVCVDPGYRALWETILDYAMKNLQGPEGVRILIPDHDAEVQAIARSKGLAPSGNTEYTAVIDIDDKLTYTLPEGYRIVSLEDRFDLCEYNRVLHRGFNHPGEEPNDHDEIMNRLLSLSGPDARLDLDTAVVSPEGHFVAYCGMWHQPGTHYSYVEPVATDPAFRNKGFGKVAVLAAVIKSGKSGAKRAFVGSNQDFYYRIGFKPFWSETYWEAQKSPH
jgi:GNAT superfamily N-acetyltransferase